MDSISTQRKPAPEQAKKELAEQLWLSYYNQVLFEAGLITETERNRMKNKISTLAPSASNGVDRSVLTCSPVRNSHLLVSRRCDMVEKT